MQPQKPSERQPILLVIDDEPLMTDMLRQSMTRRNFQVFVASSGREALDILNKLFSESLLSSDSLDAPQNNSADDSAPNPVKCVDIVLTDMTMPDMDGVAVAQELWKRVPEVPVVITTGHDLDPSQIDLPPNVVRIIRKPYPTRTLADQLHEILKIREEGSQKSKDSAE